LRGRSLLLHLAADKHFAEQTNHTNIQTHQYPAIKSKRPAEAVKAIKTPYIRSKKVKMR
jgi:hypothetical protein